METPVFRLEQVVRAAHELREDFEGPLDLILHLLSKNRIEIRDIKISELLGQYLAYLEQMKRMDLEIATEFVTMASHLVYIKSRMLLSASDEQPAEELDLLMQALEERRRLEEYRRITAGRDFLTTRAGLGRDLFLRPPETLNVDKTYDYTHSADELAAAMAELAARFGRRIPPTPAAFQRIVGREPYAVDDMISLIVRRLSQGGRERFSRLLALGENRSEWVALFLALLELCRGSRLRIEDCPGGDFEVDLNEQQPA
ncbi:MAG: segregation/condensation protein A [Oscillospiraceae bacterium]|jgi:segregation and condensation protein A|nr:segregation/condensation protein A [Oscillospiraceae bacterium]